MILILGGTRDSIELGLLLKNRGYKINISTATTYGEKLVCKNGLETFSSKLHGCKMDRVLKDNKIKAVIDASHPYATKVTYNTKEACKKCNIPLLRLERPETKLPDSPDANNVYYVKDYYEACEKSFSLGNRVLLTTGSRNLKPFVDIKPFSKESTLSNPDSDEPLLYVRVLPEKDSIIKCQESGLTPDQIIAIKGPLDYKLNKAIMESYNISVVVIKDSGITGGTPEKIKAALDLGIYVVIIKRPDYENIPTAKTAEEVLSWLEKRFGNHSSDKIRDRRKKK